MLHLPKLFSDGAVFQREKPIKVWGTFEPFSKIKLSLEDSVAEVITDQDGNFKATLKAPKYGFNKQLIFKNESGETLKSINVSVGDVWILSGQSNMDFMLKYDQNYQQDADKVTSVLRDGPAISFFEVPRRILPNGEFDQSTNPEEWHILTKENAKLFSAIGYYFGLELRDYSPDIPIGLIWMSFGGTTASAWLSEEALAKDPLLKQRYLDSYQELLSSMSMDKYEAILAKQHETSLLPEAAKFWDDVVMGKIDHKTLNEAYKNKKYLFNDQIMGPKSENRPHGLFDNMVKTIIGYTIKGVLWYQGENDSDDSSLYDHLLIALIQDWRNHWEDDFPFLIMQLAPFGHWFGNVSGEFYPEVREKQAIVADKLNKVYLTNVMDDGIQYDIHPKNKKLAAHRFYLLAMDKVYDVINNGAAPSVDDCEKYHDHLTISFDNCNLLASSQKNLNKVLKIIVNGKGIQLYDVSVSGNLMTITSPEFKSNATIEVWYQQEPFSHAGLFNENAIPVVPFKVYL